MAKNQTRRIGRKVLQADEEALIALRAMETYKPSNPNYELALVESAEADLADAEEKRTLAANAFKAASDKVTEKQWARHNLILGCRKQVVAQFGDDSNQAQSVGLKKKSEYKTPKRRKNAASARQTTAPRQNDQSPQQ